MGLAAHMVGQMYQPLSRTFRPIVLFVSIPHYITCLAKRKSFFQLFLFFFSMAVCVTSCAMLHHAAHFFCQEKNTLRASREIPYNGAPRLIGESPMVR